jgi:protein-S-isoprenylcysteine O-methyltransferase Ste14
MSNFSRALELRIPPLALTALAALIMWVVSSAWPSYLVPPSWALILASALAVAGVGMCLSAVVSFRTAKTTVNPSTPGAASHVVSSGIYRYTRNPMYLAFLLILVAWAISLASPLSSLLLLVFVAYLNRFQIKPEERALLTKFGAPYSQYMNQVRRWV